MEISFYVLLVVACLVLLLAMWACAGSGIPKWGPDLTLELPPHMIQEALFGTQRTKERKAGPVPSAPSDLSCDPLLSNEHGMGLSSPPPRHHRPAPRPPPKQVAVNMEGAVRVLPPDAQFGSPRNKLRPVFSSFDRA